jgi:nitroimidazol reductase NimA-like FMN-containing flavoprotein (pyridoxamine 5'-phosphate oxidase superfamily)
MQNEIEIRALLRELFRTQRYAVLATDDQGQPFTSLMAFADAADLTQLVLLTERATRKFANLQGNARVALLMDDRGNKGSDTQDSVAVTVTGRAQEVTGEAAVPLRALYLARHPQLREFSASASCAVVRVMVDSYRVVSSFQRVIEWHPAA